MDFIKDLQEQIADVIQNRYQVSVTSDSLTFTPTRKEFVGDFTLVVFALVKEIRKSPELIGQEIGKDILQKVDYVSDFNVIKGFLNLSFTHAFWLDRLHDMQSADEVAGFASTGKKLIIEFSSPNTNKPLHLGHVRNILLGWSASMIHQKLGTEVIKTQIINDRGIAICKSMLAWQKFANGATPQSENIKSDHFVGSYYVLFEQSFKKEYEYWQTQDEAKSIFETKRKEDQDEVRFFKDFKNVYFNEFSPLGAEAKEMLLKWEANDEATINLWKQMNQWVYEGFDTTYDALGVDFDSKYYESDTYKLGKNIIGYGLEKGVFYKKDDGSVWIDLEDVGLDQKLVLRSDGTSVYMTQDMGTARKRYEDTDADGMVYVVADEQDYHFQALFEILKKLGESYADHLYHLSYGMVDLPTGRMKSREGKVVDADDLIEEVIQVAKENTEQRGEIGDESDAEQSAAHRMIGLGALKFFILKVNPKKRMVFNPEESVDMQGTTGPYVQYAYVRIQSIVRKAEQLGHQYSSESYTELHDTELYIVKLLNQYRDAIIVAGEQYDPSVIAMYAYELAKGCHKFIHDVRILNSESEAAQAFRLELSLEIARTLQDAFQLLGIEMPEKM